MYEKWEVIYPRCGSHVQGFDSESRVSLLLGSVIRVASLSTENLPFADVCETAPLLANVTQCSHACNYFASCEILMMTQADLVESKKLIFRFS